MEPLLVLTLAIGSLMVLMFLGVPVAFAFITINIVGLYILYGSAGFTLIIGSFYESMTNIGIAPVPLFILLGEILFRSGSVVIIFDAINKVAGNIRARLYIVSLLVATVFGALSGSAMAVAAMLGSMLLPEMKKQKYSTNVSVSCILAGAALAPIIPPSILCVLIATQAQISVAQLLIAGVIPGLLFSGLAMIYISVFVFIKPEIAPLYESSQVSIKEKFIAVARALPFILIVFCVIGLILLGVATPTESAATGVACAFLLAFLYKKLTLGVIKDTIIGTIKVSGMLLFIVAGSKAFSQLLAGTGAVQEIIATVETLPFHPMAIFTIMLLIIFILGCFIDPISIILITIPVYLPVVTALNFDPLLFWLLFLILTSVAGLTPPFGLMLFSLKGTTSDITLERIFLAALPIVLLYLFGMFLIALFPDFFLWLPRMNF